MNETEVNGNFYYSHETNPDIKIYRATVEGSNFWVLSPTDDANDAVITGDLYEEIGCFGADFAGYFQSTFGTYHNSHKR